LAVNTSKRPRRAVRRSGGARASTRSAIPYTINGITYTPAVDYNYDETGIAFVVTARAFHEKYTANGEIYDPELPDGGAQVLAAADLRAREPISTTAASMVLRINDRGPYAQGRIIDIIAPRRPVARLRAGRHRQGARAR